MKFPNTLTLDGYATLLKNSGCEMLVTEDTGRYRAARRPLSEHAEHAVNLRCPADHRFRYDADGIVGRRDELPGDMAHAGKIAQGLFIARKKA